MEYELRPIHDSRKSFYNKAVVIEENGVLKLKSYNTIVCKIENNKPLVFGTYSNTTLRHIKEFLKQNGFKADNINDVRAYFPTEEEKNAQNKEAEEKFKSFGNTLKMMCAMGEVLNKDKKDQNNFKKRILKAGLEKKGLSFPDDWDNLNEEVKTERLNKAIEVL